MPSMPNEMTFRLDAPARVAVMFEGSCMTFADPPMEPGKYLNVSLPQRNKRIIIALLETALEEVKAL